MKNGGVHDEQPIKNLWELHDFSEFFRLKIHHFPSTSWCVGRKTRPILDTLQLEKELFAIGYLACAYYINTMYISYIYIICIIYIYHIYIYHIYIISYHIYIIYIIYIYIYLSNYLLIHPSIHTFLAKDWFKSWWHGFACEKLPQLPQPMACILTWPGGYGEMRGISWGAWGLHIIYCVYIYIIIHVWYRVIHCIS